MIFDLNQGIKFLRYGFSLFKLKRLNSKSDSHLPNKIMFMCFDEGPLKMMKNTFYFVLKALVILKIFKFMYWLFGHVEKTGWLER